MTSASTSATNPTDDGSQFTIVVATDAEDRFLMVRHRRRGWELPGGKLEKGEGPVHCALREFREETGHLLASPRFVLKEERDPGTCYVFTGSLGAPAEGKDQDDAIEWFDVLPPAQELAFPDDPYEAIGDALGIRFR